MNNEKEIISSKMRREFFLIPIALLLAGIIILILSYTCVIDGTLHSTSWGGYYYSWETPDYGFVTFGWCLCGLGILYFVLTFGSKLSVTDKRVYGRGLLGKRVDIPVDSISSVGRVGWLNSVIVSSSSGKIRFLYLANAKDIYSVLTGLIVDRQSKSAGAVLKQEVNQSVADELKKFKDLLDNGIITQEEFDDQKNQLLGR